MGSNSIFRTCRSVRTPLFCAGNSAAGPVALLSRTRPSNGIRNGRYGHGFYGNGYGNGNVMLETRSLSLSLSLCPLVSVCLSVSVHLLFCWVCKITIIIIIIITYCALTSFLLSTSNFINFRRNKQRQNLNQSNWLFFRAPKSWPESWLTSSAARRNN